MRVAVITTSRADYGIYRSLLRELANANDVEYGLLVAGTHLSRRHGYTLAEIEADGHPVWASVETVPENDQPIDIARATGQTVSGFAEVYASLPRPDFVVALGDRYEMFGAVAATVPFGLQVAHLHGGEKTTGAIDDRFRHAITVMSAIHFPATERYGQRVAEITGDEAGIFVVGSLAMDDFAVAALPSIEMMRERFGIDFTKETILVTLHPETVNYRNIGRQAAIFCAALAELAARYQIVVTLPNADTAGTEIRAAFNELAGKSASVILLENFGKDGYFAAMQYSRMLLGNSSSGLLEAPSFGKFAINVGSRQAGRERSANVLDVNYDTQAILSAVREIEKRDCRYSGNNVYVKYANAGRRVVTTLREVHRAASMTVR